MRITRRAGLKGLTASAAAVAMPGMARSEEPEIVIGAPNSLTGGLGEGGQRTVWALQIAIDQINREGGIKSLRGAKLRLVVADTTSENLDAGGKRRTPDDRSGKRNLAGRRDRECNDACLAGRD